MPSDEAERIELEAAEERVRRSPLSRMAPAIIVVAFLGVAAGVYFGFIRHKATTTASVKAPRMETPKPAETRQPPEFGDVYSISDIITNPADGRRHFMLTVSLEYHDKTKLPEIQKREPLLRDNLITFFSSQPIEVLTNIRYRQAIRSRVQKIMDYQLGEGVISRVFFDKWVFQ